MHYGFIIPGGDVHSIPALAAEAEATGWDGVFIPDCISIETPTHPASEWFDPWILLALMAARTQCVRLGTMLTPSRGGPGSWRANWSRSTISPTGAWCCPSAWARRQTMPVSIIK